MLSKTASEIMKVLIHQDDEFITYEKIAGLLEISQCWSSHEGTAGGISEGTGVL